PSFHDDQLRSLLQLVSNTCVLSMSQNQIIDSWLTNIEQRTFEKQDSYDDDDDDDLYEDITESEDDEKTKNVTKNTNNESKLSFSKQHK
ncbi:unnamed protein product, partial [Rotaria sp. Silwood2]